MLSLHFCLFLFLRDWVFQCYSPSCSGTNSVDQEILSLSVMLTNNVSHCKLTLYSLEFSESNIRVKTWDFFLFLRQGFSVVFGDCPGTSYFR